MDEHAQRMRSYIHALEEEKRKIQVFHRELPLCFDLVNKAIENYRQQLSGTTTEYVHGGQSECSEQTSTQRPLLEEFIPIKRPCSGSDYNGDETEQDSGHKQSEVVGGLVADAASDNKRKSDWLRSAQLWNQTSSVPPHEDDPPPKRVPVLEVKRNVAAFKPFNRDRDADINYGSISLSSNPSSRSLDKKHNIIPSTTTSSTAETVAASTVSRQPQRKQRRNWSPVLHRRFLQALEQLGGSHSATPKQIRESMKVDGLTNDEVKSHLQKYRLHTRRTGGPNTILSSRTASQFLLVTGMWLPPAATASSEEPSKAAAAMYTPLANLDLEKQPDESEGRGSHSGGSSDQSNLQSTSSYDSHNHRSPFPNDPVI